MKLIFTMLSLIACTMAFGQIPSYYNDVNLNLTGSSLQNELSSKVTSTHTNFLSYTPGVWDALKQSDKDPSNSSKVILVYGYNDNDGVLSTDRTRGINNNGGATTDWNREHVYPKSLGNPNLGTSGPGADAHHLRPCDPARNSSRSNRKFQDGSGNSGITSQGHWYPGDEFKGDVARMILFMYIRYGDRCLPSNVGVGTTNSSDNDMINLFLEWNAEDPVSAFELQRNPIIENIQGNRNPFIDNPAFATSIWGGPQAEDRFGGGGNGGGNDLCTSTINSFPYGESFESNFGGWNQAGADDFNWTRRSGSTPSSGTGPSSANDGNTYIYMESSTPNYSTKRAILYGPCFDLVNESQASFSFKYHIYGASNMGSLTVEASLDGTSWSSIWSISGNQGNSWKTANINLSAYLGENVQLRLNGITGTTWKGDMAVDDMDLITSGGGGSGGDIAVNLSITLDNYPEETSWVIRDANNTIVHSGGTYGNQSDGSTINISTPLPAGCYTLVFSDTYGDGICCSYGNGSYTLSETNGAVLASGGSFGSTDTKSFCVGSSNRVVIPLDNDFENDIQFDFYPNPVDEILSLDAPSESNFQIISQTGKVIRSGAVKATLNVGDIPAGMYFISIIHNGEQVIKPLIIQ